MSGAITSIEDAAGRSGWFPPEGAGSGSRLACRRVAGGIPCLFHSKDYCRILLPLLPEMTVVVGAVVLAVLVNVDVHIDDAVAIDGKEGWIVGEGEDAAAEALRL